MADRLPAGKRYVVLLIKPARKGGAWQVDVATVGRSLELVMGRSAAFPLSQLAWKTGSVSGDESENGAEDNP